LFSCPVLVLVAVAMFCDTYRSLRLVAVFRIELDLNVDFCGDLNMH